MTRISFVYCDLHVRVDHSDESANDRAGFRFMDAQLAEDLVGLTTVEKLALPQGGYPGNIMPDLRSAGVRPRGSSGGGKKLTSLVLHEHREKFHGSQSGFTSKFQAVPPSL